MVEKSCEPENLSLFSGLLLSVFKPCKVVLGQAGVTEFMYEDVAHYARPVVEGEYHRADWLLAMDDDRLVGLALWRTDL